jgi:N-methylhydantoinase B
MLEDSYTTAAIERTKNPPWGLEGGLEGVPNTASLVRPDGSRTTFGKATRLLCAKGSTLELRTGGGGGYGDPSERPKEEVHADLREGYITEEHARRYYPHAFGDAA